MALAESQVEGRTPPRPLNDFDVPYLIGVCWPGQEAHSTGHPLGEHAGWTILYWPMNPAEEALWRETRKGGPKLVPSSRTAPGRTPI